MVGDSGSLRWLSPDQPQAEGWQDRPADHAAADPEREARLFEILTAYLQAAESGRAPERREFLASHPDFAAELAEFLDEEVRLQHLTEPLAPATVTLRRPAATLRPATHQAETGHLRTALGPAKPSWIASRATSATTNCSR